MYSVLVLCVRIEFRVIFEDINGNREGMKITGSHALLIQLSIMTRSLQVAKNPKLNEH